jgi:DNA repair ATPase RecN
VVCSFRNRLSSLFLLGKLQVNQTNTKAKKTINYKPQIINYKLIKPSAFAGVFFIIKTGIALFCCLIMLSKLSIQNYAIIHGLEIDFSAQLNILTGETGAGKSIIVGALGLILGQRAESSVLLNKEKKCVIEGVFRNEQVHAQVIDFLKANELDINDEVVVRREIAPSGKSRAFINDTPVNLGQLNQLSNLLVDLHQQFDTLEIGESDFQREVLDALAGNASRYITNCKLPKTGWKP